ncbi:class I SAM-dependent methyltransferase [Nocardioides mangrovi]|uniref:Class I SAM-dependent methyltransferase n=1 Tax=Nocardioides mangrovi TaxID=2874580 RepID=A0ABS7UH89_9ACTN|nr:class I SAM-dependent methyltransferase [Nocardioides mangrovi]MBZ5740389.1 class I SAM-dependent methyltransferase [Nocardioides mangrovi]
MTETTTLLRLDDWDRPPDADDHALLDLCLGATLDVGCGPGRLATALAERGHVVLGIDVVTDAVGRTLRRGASALRRDVFSVLPGEGRWCTALLADGNIGIGGDPVALLHRLRELLDPRGRVVAELAPPGAPSLSGWATLRWGADESEPIPWSVLGVDDVDAVAAEANLDVRGVHRLGDRWCAVLEERP